MLTKDQENALSAFKKGENLLILGAAGTGKSYLIQIIKEYCDANNKQIAITASTGIAAQNIDGVTIQSFLKTFNGELPPPTNSNSYEDHNDSENFVGVVNIEDLDDFDLCDDCNDSKDHTNFNLSGQTTSLKEIDVLIIDEISMLGARFIEFLYQCLSTVEKYNNKKIQLILVGDFYQLPPVKDKYAFQSNFWNALDLCIYYLNEVKRQDNVEFIQALNKIRTGDTTGLDYIRHNSSKSSFNEAITICARNKDADDINSKKLEDLNGNPREYAPTGDLESIISNRNKIISSYPIPETIVLKEGARVMCTRNIDNAANGSIGTVSKLSKDSITIKFDHKPNQEIKIGRVHYTFTLSTEDNTETNVTIEQFPLRLAYAITIHKSQGLTFDEVNINAPWCWAPGQVYTALSRAKSVDKIYFSSSINSNNITVSNDVQSFYSNPIAA